MYNDRSAYFLAFPEAKKNVKTDKQTLIVLGEAKVEDTEKYAKNKI